MERLGARTGGSWLLGLACAAVFAGCTTGATTGAFVPVQRIEQELRRGVSSKSDVQRVLGTPKGYGSMVFPQDLRNLEVWYYEDIALTKAQAVGDHVIRVDMRQQILLVTFDGSVLDGFVWFTNAGPVREK